MGLFRKKELEILAPLSGEAIVLKDVNDPVFSQGMMGEGAAIVPTNGDLFAPVDGEVVMIAPTKHALGLKTKEGVEIMLHFGIDSFKTDGNGFEYYVKIGDKISAGDKIGSLDLEFFKKEKIDMTTVVVLLNKEKITKNVEHKFDITKGEILLKYIQ